MSYAVPNYPDTHPARALAYRPCVGIVLLNNQGLVWCGKRRADKLPGDAPLWQLPQGGIDEGETPIAAAYRELAEETGVTKAELIYELPDWLPYDLPEGLIGTALKGRFRGQKQKWFAMKFLGEDSDINLTSHSQIEFDEWQWRPLSECAAMVIEFKKPIYAELDRRLAFLANPQR